MPGQQTKQSQDFFPRGGTPKTQGFIFNQAPINKKEAKEETRQGLAERTNKRSAFMAKLYADDQDEDMKVFDMEAGSDVEVQEGEQSNKRKVKIAEKSKSKAKTHIQRSKIGKLKFSKGSLGLFAVNSIHEDYVIVNYTRNVKGYISFEGKEDLLKSIEIGQLIVAAILSEGKTEYKPEAVGQQNRKLQLSIEPEVINKSLTNENVEANMLLQGVVESKEAKGYLVNFGMKDQTKGFISFQDKSSAIKVGGLVQVIVKSATKGSKVIKCELLNKDNAKVNVHNKNELTMHNVKPGFLVNAKVSQLYENGLEALYMGGFTGTIFIDHLERQDPNKYKIGEKIVARIIAVDPATKSMSLSQLDHIIKFENSADNFLQNGVQLGKVYDKVKIQKVVYGQSYQIQLAKGVNAFLHKIHTAQKEKNIDSETVSRPKDLEAGQVLEKVRVKELNYFDASPILSMRDDIVSTVAMNYDSLEIGMTLNATIVEVNENLKHITLKVNDFVKGKLFLEHMADFAIKVIPPKFKAIGKEIKVRIFDVDPESRDLEFTKKDSLMKPTIPVYKSQKEISKGDKIYGLLVKETEFGFVIKTFGGIQCFLRHDDIKAHRKSSKKELKVGSIVKGYALFSQKDKGVALTLDKVKAKELRKGEQAKKGSKKKDGDSEDVNKFEDSLPSSGEIEQIKTKYKTMIKPSSDAANIGKVFQFRVVETSDQYMLVKSTDASKKSLNIVAVLPKCLVSNQASINILTQSDQTFSALVLELHEGIPVVSSNGLLVDLKAEIPSTSAELESQGSTYIGFVSAKSNSALTVRFLAGQTRQVIYKDLESKLPNYKIGQVVRAGKNKLDRLTLKQRVIYYGNQKLQQKDKELQISKQFEDFSKCLKSQEIKIGQKVEAQVQLIKDYGLILALPKYPTLTGFIMNEHQAQKTYKENDKLQCVILDIDFEKNIADLSEKVKVSESKSELKKGQSFKAQVELSKEDYIIASIKGHKTLAICMMNSFNNDNEINANEKYHIGDEVDLQVFQNTDSGLVLTIPVIAPVETKQSNKTKTEKVGDLIPGLLIQGVIRSIKGLCAFVQILNKSELTIGRLHFLECQNEEFNNFTVGQNIQAKVLKITKDAKKTWVELTRKKDHLSKTQGLDNNTLQQTVMSFDDLKEGGKYKAVISDINFAFSHPLSIQLSPFVRSSIAFNQILSAEQLIKEGSTLLNEFKVGKIITVTYKNGLFTLVENFTQKKKNEKGDILVARFVKSVLGKGITIQVGDQQFGFVEICEITDTIEGRVFDFIKDKAIFPVRLIDFEQNGKAVYSARETVVDENKWKLISPQGKSVHFQKYDQKAQQMGNQRNKILKYGAKVALHEGDLCLGYVSGIGKSGCFIQIGHNCTVRAALNELSESPNFNFVEEMPIGRQVLGRITRIEEKADKKWYHFSLRKSLIVYGTSVIDRSALEVGNQVEAIILTFTDGKAFAQLKGSYLKLKVKNYQEGEIREGDHVMTKLTKVTKQKISSEFVQKIKGTGLNEEEKIVEKLFNSVQEEAQKDIVKAQEQASSKEIDEEMFKKVGKTQQDEVEMQIEDLKELEQEEQDQEEDSDAEEMQRIIKESKMYEDDEDEESGEEESKGSDDEDVEMEGNDDEAEEGSDAEVESDAEMQDMSGDSSEEEVQKTKKSGKKALKDRIKEEQEIRKKENQMRDNTDQPQNLDDFERLLIKNQDQSYVWIQYMAFMIDKLGIESARRISERAVKSVSISNEEDKFNIWIAYMNLENNFGNQQTLEKIVKRALEVNDRKKIYLQLIQIYKSSHKYEHIEDIFKQLCKKFNTSLKVWSGYLDFLFEMRDLKNSKDAKHKFLIANLEFAEPKQVLQRALQSLPQSKHVNMISKFGMLEFKHGAPENGRTMFEGIVNNYPKRMDIWSIYMDMEVKYGGGNTQQARHLFERCLTNENIQKKPKKMKLVFQKYMEFENTHGNKKNLEKLKARVEEYLDKVYGQQQAEGGNQQEESD